MCRLGLGLGRDVGLCPTSSLLTSWWSQGPTAVHSRGSAQTIQYSSILCGRRIRRVDDEGNNGDVLVRSAKRLTAESEQTLNAPRLNKYDALPTLVASKQARPCTYEGALIPFRMGNKVRRPVRGAECQPVSIPRVSVDR